MMDNNSLAGKSSSSEINNPSIELVNTPERGFVPKIRIRLRPHLVHSSDVNSQDVLFNSNTAKHTCDTVSLIPSNSDISIWNSDKRCYKTLEDSGGGGCDEPREQKNHFMIHGINLRSRPQKIINQSQKTKCNADDKEKQHLSLSKLKPICKKNVYQSLMLKTSKDIDKINKSVENNKLSRKQITKSRNETIISNINLKEIINQENFLKFPPEIQWQLVNLLPNCDKPKISSEPSSCKCTDYADNSNENYPILPNLGFSVLNNEFLGKALTKFSLKMGQCDLINILNSERENLRSRPLTILNDDNIVKSIVENETKVETETKVDNNENSITSGEDKNKVLEEIKSNSSSTTTETVEMYGGGNIDDKNCIEFQDNSQNNASYDNKLITLKYELNEQKIKENENGLLKPIDNSLEPSIPHEITVKEENVDIENPICFKNVNQAILINIEEKELSSKLLRNFTVEINNSMLTNIECVEEHRRKRGRKRKLFNSTSDLQIIPIKRSNRSTAGKRPARLDSESPPMSPNIFTINDKKLNIKCKKYKDQIHSNKKHKLKFESCNNQLDSLLQMELKSCKRSEISPDASKSFKICPSSPDSIFSVHNESDLSPLSKPFPNGNSLFNNFSRSNVLTNHINSVQTLSPSWSCTSESTTPSAKSDYGHNQPIKLNSNVPGHISEIQDSNTLIDSDVKPIQRMPPPRQTLTLAAMREKMRAKKLAKEDNKKITNSNNRKSSTYLNNQRLKKQNINALLKEGEDDYKLMEKMISNSEDIDDLLNNSQESLLRFFMGNNYEFDTVDEQCNNSNSINCKPCLNKKSYLKSTPILKEKMPKGSMALTLNNSINNSEENSGQTNAVNSIESKFISDKTVNSCSESSILNDQVNKDPMTSEKSFTDAISYVLQKLNLSKDNNNKVLSHNATGKSSLPSAYLVDSNGLTNALSIIQSLNPGAKVTTQQFYLVNSGPQLVLQPNPPLAVASEKIPTNSNPVGFQTKVSLAPKITNPLSIVNHLSNANRDNFPSISNSFTGLSMSPVSYNSMLSDKSLNLTSETNLDCRMSTSLKVSVTEPKNTFMVSSITPNISTNQPRGLHLQTISTPQPIGFVQPVQQPLPSLFQSQLRFMQPTMSNATTPNSISFLTSNNASIVNSNQSPKLLFLCPTVQNNSNLVTASNVLNQDQKYLLLSKQPDKQATIQLVSSQGLWQQLNPNIISQPNNVLVMQSQPINTVYESLICPSTFLPAISPINSDYSINKRKHPCPPNDITQISTSSVFKEPSKQLITTIDSTSSSLIIDSRSMITNSKIEPLLENINRNGKSATTESSMSTSLSNHTCLSINNAFSLFPSHPSVTSVINENNCNIDEHSTLLADRFKGSAVKADQLDILQSSQDVNLS